jgi:hypothetical protein
LRTSRLNSRLRYSPADSLSIGGGISTPKAAKASTSRSVFAAALGVVPHPDAAGLLALGVFSPQPLGLAARNAVEHRVNPVWTRRIK